MKKKSVKYSPEVMERAARMVFAGKEQYDSQWAAIVHCWQDRLYGRNVAALGAAA